MHISFPSTRSTSCTGIWDTMHTTERARNRVWQTANSEILPHERISHRVAFIRGMTGCFSYSMLTTTRMHSIHTVYIMHTLCILASMVHNIHTTRVRMHTILRARRVLATTLLYKLRKLKFNCGIISEGTVVVVRGSLSYLPLITSGMQWNKHATIT